MDIPDADAGRLERTGAHVVRAYGLVISEPGADDGLGLPIEDALESCSGDPSGYLEGIVRRFAPHADGSDSKLLQYGLARFCGMDPPGGIFDSTDDVRACCDRWEFAVGDGDKKLEDREARRIAEISGALAARYGLVDHNGRADGALMRQLRDITDFTDNTNHLLKAARRYAGQGPTDIEVRVAAMAVVPQLSDYLSGRIWPRLLDLMGAEDLRGLIESHDASRGLPDGGR